MLRSALRSTATLATAVALAGAAVAPASAHTPGPAGPKTDLVNLGDSFSAG